MAEKRVIVLNQRPSALPHKSFWIYIGMLLVLSLMVILSSRGNSSVTGFSTVQAVSYIKAGDRLEMELKTVPAIKIIIIQALNDIKNGQVTFKEDPTIIFNEISISKFRVNSPNAADFGLMEITVKVTQADLEAVGLRKEELRLFVNGQSITLTPIVAEKLVEQSGEYVFYSANLPFQEGEFVLGRGTANISEQQGMNIPFSIPREAINGESMQPEKTGIWISIKNFFKKILRLN